MKNIELETLTSLLRNIGLYNPDNRFYKGRERKYHQALAYIEQVTAVFNRLSTKRPLILLDACCGRSYVSFLLYAYCIQVLRRPVKIIGVDRNPKLIEQNKTIAAKLGYEKMEFYAANLEAFEYHEPLDIVYSLHACDMATDYVIAKGIKARAKYIFSVSCCQHQSKKQLQGHPLHAASRFRPYKERLVDMLGDALRSLLLEQHNYGVNVFEFVGSAMTAKNIMLRATKGAAKQTDIQSALSTYKQLVNLFNVKPVLEKLLEE